MPQTKKINLALQGGGAHGAFTWGVLDRLLEEEAIEIDAISGTSAGALNGAALKAGMISGGRDGAKENLAWLWSQVGAVEDEATLAWLASVSPTVDLMAKALEYSPAYAAMDSAMRVFSPYSPGPFYSNPLRPIVEQFHWDEVCAEDQPTLYVGATNVRSGKICLFKDADIGPDALLASACLPTLFQAVECVDPSTGTVEAFWDGGYTGNPALFPLYGKDHPDDIVVVNINPLSRDEVPTDPQMIQNRINEISFNSSLLREMRAIDFVQRLLEQGTIKRGAMKHVLVHMIADDDLMNRLNVATKLIPSPTVLADLHQAGRAAASGFIETHLDDLGQRSTVNLREMFA